MKSSEKTTLVSGVPCAAAEPCNRPRNNAPQAAETTRRYQAVMQRLHRDGLPIIAPAISTRQRIFENLFDCRKCVGYAEPEPDDPLSGIVGSNHAVDRHAGPRTDLECRGGAADALRHSRLPAASGRTAPHRSAARALRHGDEPDPRGTDAAGG